MLFNQRHHFAAFRAGHEAGSRPDVRPFRKGCQPHQKYHGPKEEDDPDHGGKGLKPVVNGPVLVRVVARTDLPCAAILGYDLCEQAFSRFPWGSILVAATALPGRCYADACCNATLLANLESSKPAYYAPEGQGHRAWRFSARKGSHPIQGSPRGAQAGNIEVP